MSQGLGKNSPVVLSLGKDNYEALIDRHGQWVRWRVAEKCPCTSTMSGQPDIHCERCGGLGFTYTTQEKAIVTQTVMVKDTSGIIDISSDYEDCSLIKCYDNSGVQYPNATKTGCFVMLNADALPAKSVYVTVVMEQEITKIAEQSDCENLGANYFRVSGLRVSKTSIDGVYYSVPSDIIEIGQVEDSEGNLYEIDEYRQDCFHVDSKETLNVSLIAKDVKYIEPFTFVILSQNLNKADANAVTQNNGDAILTFPYGYNVSNDDILTVLTGSYTEKNIITRTNAKYDTLPAYFIDSVLTCKTDKREYKQGVDFLLCGTNYLKWLCEDAPQPKEPYSITYNVLPTYKVVKNIPQIRTSENQRLPKKAVIKLFTTYGEKRGVNRQ